MAPEPVRNRPLVGLLAGVEIPRRSGILGKHGSRNRHRIVSLDALDVTAVVGKHGERAGLERETIDGPRLKRRQQNALWRALESGRFKGLRGRQLDRRRVERGQSNEPLLCGKLRHPLVDHHDAGRKPDEKDQAEDEAEVPMHDDEGCNQSFHGKSQILSEFLDVRAVCWTEPRRVPVAA